VTSPRVFVWRVISVAEAERPLILRGRRDRDPGLQFAVLWR
jgi:hypothetical protein